MNTTMQGENPLDQSHTTTTEWIPTADDPLQCITLISLLDHDTGIRETGIQKRPGHTTVQKSISMGIPDTESCSSEGEFCV